MAAPQFVVPLADLEHGPKRVSWQLSRAWLQSALEGTDAAPRSEGVVELEFTKDGREVLVRGRAKVELTMTCVRTLEPMDVDLAPEIFLLLEQLPEPSAHARRQHQVRQPEARQPKGRPATNRKNTAADEPTGAWADSPVLGDSEAARDVFRGERIELDAFIREFIVLDLPMAPVRSDLHSEPEAASSPPSAGHQTPGELDPRLAPLAVIAKRMRQKEHKE